MSRAPIRLLVVLAATAIAGGCQLLIGLDGGNPRKASTGASTGGAPSSTSSTSTTGTGGTGGSTSTTATTSTSSSGTGGTGAGGMDSGPTCSPATCPAPAECTKAVCVSGVCGTEYIGGSCDGGAVCGTPDSGVQGTCVGCNVDADCTGTLACSSNNQCSLPQRLLLLAGGGTQGTIGVAFSVAEGWAAPTTLSATTTGEVAVGIMPISGQGIGLAQGPSPGSQLMVSMWNGPEASPQWSALTQLHSDVTRGKPAIVTSGFNAYVVFQNASSLYQYESYTTAGWGAAPTPVTPMGATAQPCGPSPGALAPLVTGVSLVFVNGACLGASYTNQLFNTDLTGSGWQPFKVMATNPNNAANVYPAAALAAPLSGTPELVIAYAEQGDPHIISSYRTNGSWMGVSAISGATTNDPFALAPLASGGEAVLAYRGTDGNAYTALLTTSWQVPQGIAAAATPLLTGPAVTRGIGAAQAELAYIDATGALWHSRLIANAWSKPVAVAPAMKGFAYVAIASGP